MLPSNFRQANLVLNGPEGSGIIPLPVFANKAENTMTSLWIPSDEERQIIANGGGVSVTLLGGEHPPIKIGAAVYNVGEHYGAQDEPKAS